MQISFSREERLQMLSGHLSKVARLVGDVGEAGKPISFDSESGRLRFEAPETEMVQRALHAADDAVPDFTAVLLAETLALRLKVSEDVRGLEAAAKQEAGFDEAIIEKLELDLAIGETLIADYTLVIEQMFIAEQRGQAGRLGELRLAVRQDAARIRRAMSEIGAVPPRSEVGGPSIDAGTTEHPPPAASELGVKSPALAGPTGEVQRDERRPMPDDPVAASRRRIEERRRQQLQEERSIRQKRRVRVLLVVLAATALVGAVRLAIELMPAFEIQETKVLTIEDFSDLPIIKRVDARPPSLFVRVFGEQWRALDEQGRREVVSRIGRMLRTADYNGAKIRDEEGTLLGEWIRGVGEFVYPP